VSHDEIVALLQAQFPAEAFPALEPDPGRACVRVAPAALPAVARFLRDDPRLGFNFLRCISGLDLHPEPWFELVYDLLALRPGAPGALWQHAGTLALRVRVARDGGTAPSLAAVWPAAEWHEREAYDLYGLPFDHHPDLRRILCPDDWAGWPLRRDYEFPKEYEGIPSAAAVEP
jgi:NADH-quinone oxidoreductase subunit C